MILSILPDSCMVLFDNWRLSLNPLYTGSGTVCGWACNMCIVYYNQLYTRQTFCGFCLYRLEYVPTHCNCFSHQSCCRVVGPHTLWATQRHLQPLLVYLMCRRLPLLAFHTPLYLPTSGCLHAWNSTPLLVAVSVLCASYRELSLIQT